MTADRSAAGVDSGPIVRGSGENPGEGNVGTPVGDRETVLRVLRAFWPESGGQSGHRQALAAQDACADAILHALNFPPF